MRTATPTLLTFLILSAAACGPKAAPPPTTPPTEATPEPATSPVPEGFNTLTPQLTIKGVDDAIAFYEAALGAERLFAMPGPDGATVHAEIRIGDSIIMLDEENVEQGMRSPLSIGGTAATLMVYLDDADTTYAAAVQAGAEVLMPIEEQFWGDRYGELVDPFGHRWALATHVEDLTPEQMGQRAQLLGPPPTEGSKKGKKAKKPKKGAPPPWKEIAGTPATDPTPEPYHTVTVAIVVDDAASAIAFYEKAFGATQREAMPDDSGKLLHAELSIGDSILMLSDEFPQMGGTSAKTLGGSSVALHMYVDDVDGAVARASEAGATTAMPVADMFWGDRYGAVVDASGFMWGVATHVEDVTPEQMQERMAAQAGAAPPAEAAEAEATPAS